MDSALAVWGGMAYPPAKTSLTPLAKQNVSIKIIVVVAARLTIHSSIIYA
jgi:hypothetical protein